nr:hypothetical protein [Candidatus Sigynarchaeum springense]
MSSLLLAPLLVLLATCNEHGSLEASCNIILVQDSAAPSSTQPANQSVLVNQPGVVITWTITDPEHSSGVYLVGHDDYNPIEDENPLNLYLMPFPVWTNNTPFSVAVNTSQPGLHNYTIFFSDMTKSQLIAAALGGQEISGNYSTAWVKVEAPPVIDAPAVLKLHRGAIVSWNFTINDPDSTDGEMNVTVDGMPVLGVNTRWNASQPVSIPVNTSIPGVFNHSISATDGNYTIRFSCLVSVATNYPPEVIGLQNRTVSYDDGMVPIAFTIVDMENMTGNYTLQVDGLPINATHTNATWNNNTAIQLGFPLNRAGIFQFSLTVDDLGFNRTVVIFTINANAPPSASSPQNSTYHLLSTGAQITWTVIDPDDAYGTYTVRATGPGYDQVIKTGSWTNASTVVVSISTQMAGTWLYTLSIFDGYSTRQITTEITILESVLDEQGATIVMWVFFLAGCAGTGMILASKGKKN